MRTNAHPAALVRLAVVRELDASKFKTWKAYDAAVDAEVQRRIARAECHLCGQPGPADEPCQNPDCEASPTTR